MTNQLARTALFLVIIGSIVSACADTRPPRSVYFGCDSSGASPNDVCSPDVAARALYAWGKQRPPTGSRFVLVHSGGSLTATDAAPPIVMPQLSRGQQTDWLVQRLADVATYAMPDDSSRTKDNVSDLVAVLFVTSREAARHPNEQSELVLASDGFLRSLGLNAETRIVTAEQVLAALRASHLKIDLSVFVAVTICGFHHHGSPALIDARDALWPKLITALRGPRPVILNSCVNVYPPMPAGLQRQLATLDHADQ